MALHKSVYEARIAKRFPEALCLAQTNLDKVADTWIRGASQYEASFAWEGLGCHPNAVAAIEESLRVRPSDKNGWKETCARCAELKANCGPCSAASSSPCPSGRAASEVVARALGTKKAITVLGCTSGSYPDAGWTFVAWEGVKADGGAEGNPVAHHHHAVIRATGTLVADQSEEATWHERMDDEDTDSKALRSVDLDGDGVDEVIEQTEYTRRGWIVGNLTVYRIEGRSLKPVHSLQLSYDDGGMASEKGDTHCEASWSVGPSSAGGHSLTITPKKASGPSAARECVRSTATYVMRNGTLAPQ